MATNNVLTIPPPLEQAEWATPSTLPESPGTDGAPGAESATGRSTSPADPARYVFVPAHLAAVCGDCQGVFVCEAGRCPGCGSEQWVLLYPERVAVAGGAA